MRHSIIVDIEQDRGLCVEFGRKARCSTNTCMRRRSLLIEFSFTRTNYSSTSSMAYKSQVWRIKHAWQDAHRRRHCFGTSKKCIQDRKSLSMLGRKWRRQMGIDVRMLKRWTRRYHGTRNDPSIAVSGITQTIYRRWGESQDISSAMNVDTSRRNTLSNRKSWATPILSREALVKIM